MMKNNINVLVTGASNGVGQSIIRSLKLSKIKIKIIVGDIDISYKEIFKDKVHEKIVIPKVESLGSKKWFVNLLNKKKIDILFVGSEYEISFFSKNKKQIERKTKALICVSPIDTIKISLDKYKTYEFLKHNNFPCPKTYLPKNISDARKIVKRLKTPFFLKDRFGTSSRNIFLIKNKKFISGLYNFVPNPIIQEFAGYKKNNIDNEFTCGIFTTQEQELVGPFIAKRTLKNGTSWKVEVVQNEKVKKLVIKIARKLKNIGSLNIQLRDSSKGPIPIEFNSRFSGTTSIRSFFGFNEPEMFIQNYFLNKKTIKPTIKFGKAYRFTEEVYKINKKR